MRVAVAAATALASGVLERLGAPPSTALRVARSLLLADQRGVATHGLGLLPLYAELVRDGIIDPAAMPGSVAKGGCLFRVDGNRAFGQLTAEAAVQRCLEILPAQGMAAAGIVDGTHLGRLGEWAELACDRDAVFLAFTNTGGGALNVAGPTSPQRVLSTNPLAIGIPACGGLDHHVIIDFAAAQTSGSRIRETANAGGRLDPDWIVSGEGESTDDPWAFLSGSAALRPLGGRSAGHKGFGLMVAGELLGALAGNLMAGEREMAGFSNGALFCLLDATRFGPRAAWADRMDRLRHYLEARGCRLPGARGAGQAADAVELGAHVAGALVSLAREIGADTHGIEAPAPAGSVTRTW